MLTLDDIEQASDEDESDQYTTAGCKESLAKFRAVAKKLKYSPNSKATFMDICVEKGSSSDARLPFSSGSVTNNLGSNGTRPSGHPQLVLRDHPPNFSIGSARLSNIVVFIDQITEHLSTAISGTNYPPALRNACRIGLKTTNKYYSLTDASPLYRIAIVLHPSFRDEYFKLVNWEPEWITEAIRLTRDMWVTFYKPAPIAPTPASSSNQRPKPKTSVLTGLSDAAKARGGQASTGPLDIWLAGGLILEDGEPVNPLKWWLREKKSGNTHGGLLQKALDVLSCPATSVDVERAFSFGRDYVSQRRHRLSARSWSRGMAVAFYSKNGMIPDGVLHKWKHGIQADKKCNSKEKGKKKVIVVDEDWYSGGMIVI
ncbi:hypothetical protein PSTG_16866 [Puccinia striiformis f. sp. tritici PST-78]|uniref:HAT C-terminal dimerisation domain-containing protein n=1 Tax=Puccinia striiformis f. sp. tritici PST-78 TaxID=1165861 RepID=A0A0L0USE3_9BASI|nr:hypothetical protein PSTG_16866 [Puccinia striiformis f. sp. tritici PST-78]